MSLGLPNLELRWLHTDLIWSYKIVLKHVCLNFDDFLNLVMPLHVVTLINYIKYDVVLAFAVSNFFANRVVNVWNSLPLTVDFTTLRSFKRSITKVDSSSFLIHV